MMTPDQRAAWCAELLPWAEGELRRKLGDTATEFAGIGLLEAIDSYDPHAGPSVKQWARQTIYHVAVREFRKLHGRRGYSKHKAQCTMCEVNENDYTHTDPAPEDRLNTADEVVSALHRVNQLPARDRRVLTLRALGGYTRQTQSRILGIASKRLGRPVA